ncbi:MAG: hypothetical protein AAGI66_05055 [Cyanobacteria bacterium P01_H01_bin.74]
MIPSFSNAMYSNTMHSNARLMPRAVRFSGPPRPPVNPNPNQPGNGWTGHICRPGDGCDKPPLKPTK